ncbi:uncharacterized protein LOC127601476 isoform X3 [Hippocampus zosterae]|uniref:uncharacterized protein LOC127601476 isoform X3 n=1 Tax=Hippocampus zosterae TaxID=109293 RepID=UPI00223DEBCA|nr:uncharacterized protein LOC127601476 isoform X3 [Hippocampus zosterae]
MAHTLPQKVHSEAQGQWHAANYLSCYSAYFAVSITYISYLRVSCSCAGRKTTIYYGNNECQMVNSKHRGVMNVLCFFFSVKDQAVAQKDSPVSCYTIEPGMLAGIISADVLLTLIIVTITYRCASNQSSKNHKHREKDDHKVYMNVRT